MKGPTAATDGHPGPAQSIGPPSMRPHGGPGMSTGGKAGPDNRQSPQCPSSRSWFGVSPACTAEHSPSQAPSPIPLASTAAGLQSAEHRASTLRTKASDLLRGEKSEGWGTDRF